MKPGWKTSEAALSALAAIVAIILSVDAPADAWWVKIAGIVGTVLASLGYTWSRTAVKAADSAARAVEVAASSPRDASPPSGSI